jgi:hypothetical protein
MARVKFDLQKPKHERIAKNTSIGRRPKMSSLKSLQVVALGLRQM